MNTKLLIKNGVIVTSERIFEADILCENKKIVQIQRKIRTYKNIKIIDAEGKYIFPGGIDPHVHFNLKTPAGYSSDDFFTGSKAALAGGTTSFIDFVTPQKNESLLSAFESRLSEASNSVLDYSLHMSIVNWTENTAQEMKICTEKLGIKSFKTYLAYKGKNGIGLEDEAFLNVLDTAQNLESMVTVHAENGDLINFLRKKFVSQGNTSPLYHPLSRPEESEVEAVKKAISYAIRTNCPLYFVHISTQKAMKIIQKYQEKGVLIFAETCPHYLLLNEKVYRKEFNISAPFVLSPPLRNKKNNKGLWKSLNKGVVSAIGTDHCPFNLKKQKEMGALDFTKIPNGAGSVENRFELLFSYGVNKKRLTLNQLAYLTSKGAALLFGLSHRKGDIKVGLDADLVIFDSEKESIISAKNQFQNCDTSIYEGVKLRGKVEKVIVGGVVAFDKGLFSEQLPKGTFLGRDF